MIVDSINSYDRSYRSNVDRSRLAVTGLSSFTGVPLVSFERPNNHLTKKSNRLLCLRGRAHCSALRTVELGLAHTLGHKAVLNVGLSAGRLCRRSYSRVVAILACPNHSCTLAISALCASVL